MENKPWLKWTLLIGLSLTWGSSFILMKRGLISFSSLQMASFRISLSFILYSPFLFFIYRQLPKKKILPLIGTALFGSAIPAFMFALAQSKIDSSAAGILNSLTALWAVLVGVIFFKLKLNSIKLIGVILGLIGSWILITRGNFTSLQFENHYFIYVLIATICYALSVNIIKYHLQEIDAIHMAVFSFLFIGPPSLIIAYFQGVPNLILQQEALPSTFAIILLTLFSTVIAKVFFNKLVQITDPIFASTITYFIPITATIIGVIDGELVTLPSFIGMGIILLGVYIVNRKKFPKKV